MATERKTAEEEAKRKSDEAEAKRKSDEAESKKKADEAEGGEEEAEGEDEAEAERNALLALRSMGSEAKSPEDLANYRDAANAFIDEKLGAKDGDGDGDGAGAEPDGDEGTPAIPGKADEDEGEEEAFRVRRAAAEQDGFAKYADEAEEEGDEDQCEACGAPVGSGGKFAAAESVARMTHRLREKEVRFVKSNRRTGLLETEVLSLTRDITKLKAELEPIKKMREIRKFLESRKVPEGLVDAKRFMVFPQSQWAEILDISLGGLVESGEGERVVSASSLLAGKGKVDAGDEAGQAFRETYGAGADGGYKGSADAEDPYEEEK